ncbi:MAG: YndJ family protein [Acidobacteriota bacterium]
MNLSSSGLLRWNRASSLAGAMVWILLLLPLSGWLGLPVETGGETWLIERLLLLSVLVFTPLTLSLVATPAGDGVHPLPFRGASLLQPFAAILVVASFYTRTGVAAALLTAGWILVTGLIAVFGLWRMLQRWAARKSLLPMEELCIDAGLAYVTVGSGWLFLSRWGMNPLGFSDAIVLLTAVHFHYAGFAAPVLTGFAGQKIESGIARKFYLPAAAGVIAGPPLVAAGITLSRGVEVFSAVVLALSLFVLALLMLFVVVPKLKPRLARLLLSLSAISVMVTMLFACLYAMGRFTGSAIVTLPLMAQVHGVSNALGFVFCGLLAWAINEVAYANDRD